LLTFHTKDISKFQNKHICQHQRCIKILHYYKDDIITAENHKSVCIYVCTYLWLLMVCSCAMAVCTYLWLLMVCSCAMADARSSLHAASCSLLCIPHCDRLDTAGIRSNCSLTPSISSRSNAANALKYDVLHDTGQVYTQFKYRTGKNTLKHDVLHDTGQVYTQFKYRTGKNTLKY